MLVASVGVDRNIDQLKSRLGEREVAVGEMFEMVDEKCDTKKKIQQSERLCKEDC